MFNRAAAFNQNIGTWNTSNVPSLSGMFQGAAAFNKPIGTWNTSHVTDMSSLFYGAHAFNQSIGSWDTSNVTDMSGMFAGTYRSPTAFNRNIGGWDTSNVTNMSSMFFRAAAFNQSIGSWDTSHVTGMGYMLREATAFNQNIAGWDTGNVTYMDCMFEGATAFNQDIGGWNTGKVGSMDNMFSGAKAFNQNIGSWNVTHLQVASHMFDGVSLSVDNYDALLTGWAKQSVRERTVFSGGLSKYSTAGRAGRKTLTDDMEWKITDGGLTVGRLSPAPTPSVDDRTPTVDRTLTANPGVWGPAPVTLASQWYRVNSHGKVTRISSATHATYQVKGADAGYRLKVKVTGSKAGYATRSRTSALTARVAKARFTTIPVPTVTVDGTPRIGKAVTVTPGTSVPLQDRFTYQWYRGKSAIKAATKPSYKLSTKDKGRQVKVRVRASRSGYHTTTRYGLVPGLVRAGLTTVTPKLSDVTPVVGETISITPATAITVWGPQPVTGGYQWYRGSTPIAYATTAVYTVTAIDLGKKLKVAVTGTKDDYANVTRTSASSHPVAKAVSP
jgi:surface protein